MVGSYKAYASVVASWVGWIRTLTSVLVVSLDGIVSSVGALIWSYGLWWFKEVKNGVRDFVCVISGCTRLSYSDAWSRGSVGIFITSLGFARCFHKPFRSQEVISQTFSQPKGRKKHFRSPFRNQREERNIFAAKGKKETFLQPISQLRNGVGWLRNGTRVPRGGFVVEKPPAKWGCGCENVIF